MVPALEPVPMFFFGNPALGRCLARRSEAEEGHTMDPVDEFNSPYVYVGNNPVNAVDPDGMEQWEFNQDGEYMGRFDDGKKAITGAVYNYQDGTKGELITSFVFNSIESEDIQYIIKADELIKYGCPSGVKIDLNFSEKIIDIAKQGIGDIDKGFYGIGKWVYAFFESDDKMDYYVTHLDKNHLFFLAGNTAYNPRDAGNLLWGAGMRLLGFDYSSAKLGSEVNNVFFGNRQNSKNSSYWPNFKGDDKADQNAIKVGFFWGQIWGK